MKKIIKSKLYIVIFSLVAFTGIPAYSAQPESVQQSMTSHAKYINDLKSAYELEKLIQLYFDTQNEEYIVAALEAICEDKAALFFAYEIGNRFYLQAVLENASADKNVEIVSNEATNKTFSIDDIKEAIQKSPNPKRLAKRVEAIQIFFAKVRQGGEDSMALNKVMKELIEKNPKLDYNKLLNDIIG